eukprot:3751410-Amphidinium_carterae.1
MDFQRDDPLLASHNSSREDDAQDTSTALAREAALPEATETQLLDYEPGGPANSLEEHEPGAPVCWPVSQTGEPSSGHPTARPTLIPFPGEEIARLGPIEGEALRLRRLAERRTIFAMRGQRGPDDSPYSDHVFDPSISPRRIGWGQPVPQEEWERRVYVELSLATDIRDEGKGARPECHACRRRGSREVPLAKCICCPNWACERHYQVPACLERSYSLCSAHPGLEVRPCDFNYLCKDW